MTTNLTLVDELIANLEVDAKIIDAQLDMARNLRATLTGEIAAPVVEVAADPPLIEEVAEVPGPEPEPVVKAKPAKPAKPRPTRRQALTCPDCGEVFDVPQKLGAHRRFKHPGSAAKPVKSPPAKPVDADPDKVVRCSDCGEERATVAGMREHAFKAHSRSIRSIEHTPVDPKAAA